MSVSSEYNHSPFRTQGVFKSPFIKSNGNTTPLPQLAAPVISVSQTVNEDYLVNVTFLSVSGATSYRLFINGVSVGIYNSSPVTYEIDKNGTYTISLKAMGGGYKPSVNSNIETITVTNHGSYLFTGLRFLVNGLKKILIRK